MTCFALLITMTLAGAAQGCVLGGRAGLLQVGLTSVLQRPTDDGKCFSGVALGAEVTSGME